MKTASVNNVVTIRRDHLVDWFLNYSYTVDMELITLTKPKMYARREIDGVKYGNPYSDSMKLLNAKVRINFNYMVEVNHRLRIEGQNRIFEPVDRVWGARIPDSPLVEHNGSYYLETERLRINEEKYFHNQKPLPYNKIARFLIPETHPKRQGLKNPVILRDYSLDGVQSFMIAGIRHIIQ